MTYGALVFAFSAGLGLGLIASYTTSLRQEKAIREWAKLAHDLDVQATEISKVNLKLSREITVLRQEHALRDESPVGPG